MLQSLDFTVNRFFMKLFKTSNIETVLYGQTVFGCELPSVLLVKSYDKFTVQINRILNIAYIYSRLRIRCSVIYTLDAMKVLCMLSSRIPTDGVNSLYSQHR